MAYTLLYTYIHIYSTLVVSSQPKCTLGNLWYDKSNKTIHSFLHAPDFAFPLSYACGFLLLLLLGSGRRVGKGRRKARIVVYTFTRTYIHIHTQNGISCNSEVAVLRSGDRRIPLDFFRCGKVMRLASSETWGAQRRSARANLSGPED